MQLADELVNAPVEINSVAVKQGFVVTGIGNQDHPLMYAEVNIEGIVGAIRARSFTLNLQETTTLSSVKRLKIFEMPSSDKRLKVNEHLWIGAADVDNGIVKITFEEPFLFKPGMNRFGIAVDISEDASEGELFKASLTKIELVDDTEIAVNLAPIYPTTVFITQSRVVSPGDFGSASYRIPAFVVAEDGTLLAVTDKRINHSGDLPSNIDLIVQRSSDNGRTWSDPHTIWGTGTDVGFGDAAIIKERETGKIIILAVSGVGFFQSTAANPIRVIQFESDDNGLTWSGAKDITNAIYGSDCPNPITSQWKGLFPASGRMLQLRDGRLLCSLAVNDPVTNSYNNYVIYSDDRGATWTPSTSMLVRGGDESKLAQRNDGKVIISSRQGGGRIWNLSDDATGINWTQTNQFKRPELLDQNCNGEILVYTSTMEGYEKNRMLHSLCFNSGERRNVSMLLSYDEGATWPYRKSICPESSAYSTFDILPDGTVGFYYEDGTHGDSYDMVFVRFSLDWLTSGEDVFLPAGGTSEEMTPASRVTLSVQNRKLVVRGSEEVPRVFTLSGVQMNPSNQLTPGVYVVIVDNQSHKLIVQ